MIDLGKLKPMDRRVFLKRGFRSGPSSSSLPLLKDIAWGGLAAPAGAGTPPCFSKEELRSSSKAASE